MKFSLFKKWLMSAKSELLNILLHQLNSPITAFGDA